MRNGPIFRTRARVLNQLGEQLIKNESIALLELIKNSYDADASKCLVEMRSPESTENGEIIIWDNGEGMSKSTLSTAWLEIGTSYKEDLLKNERTKRTSKYERLRLGEKGIGRLGVHRLGRNIEIVTKQVNAKECSLKIDWDTIEKSTYLEDIPVSITERDPIEFKNETGTKIIIKKLRTPWTRKMARDCARSIVSLNSPFESNDSFAVNFEIQNSSWLKGILSFEDIEHYKLFAFDVRMAGNQIIEFNYSFLPWETMTKLKSRQLTIADKEISAVTRMVYKKEKDKEDNENKKAKKKDDYTDMRV